MTAPTGPAAPRPLAGRTIALPETRELDRLAQLLEAEGAATLRCPLVAILDAPDPAPVEAWLRELASGAFDDLILLTGEGLRRLITVAQRLGLREQVVAALGRVRKITRGPKPARALHELGLGPDLPAPVPTSRGIIDALDALEAVPGAHLRGRRVGLQLYGTDPNRPLVEFLEAAGAAVSPVAPYIYAHASDTARVVSLIDEMAAGRVDAIAFTSASQVDRLWHVAGEQGDACAARLSAGVGRARVAAIGPIVVEALAARGVKPDIVPGKSFVMRRLVSAIADALGRV